MTSFLDEKEIKKTFEYRTSKLSSNTQYGKISINESTIRKTSSIDYLKPHNEKTYSLLEHKFDWDK